MVIIGWHSLKLTLHKTPFLARGIKLQKHIWQIYLNCVLMGKHLTWLLSSETETQTSWLTLFLVHFQILPDFYVHFQILPGCPGLWGLLYIVWYFTSRITYDVVPPVIFPVSPNSGNYPPKPRDHCHRTTRCSPTYYTRPRPIPTLWQFKPKYVKYMGASKPASKPRKALDHCPSCPPANPLSDKGVRSTDRSSGPWRPVAPAQGWPLMPWLVLEPAGPSATPATYPMLPTWCCTC